MIDQIQITSYRVEQLSDLLHESSSKDWDYLPINELRIASYLNNPRAKSTDEVVFIAELEGQLVSFRIVLPDLLFYKSEAIRFAWNSGSWTHPNWRRKGVSSKILKKVYAAWDGRLAFTNVSPESKMLYIRKDAFLFLKRLNGRKFFLKSDLVNLFKKRYPTGNFLWALWKPVDVILNFFNTKTKKIEGLKFEPINSLTDDSIAFFDSYLKDKNGFLRGAQELNWIMKYPWISEDSKYEKTQKKYLFTLQVEQTDRKIFSIKNAEKTIGYLMLFLKNKQVTVPYLHLNEMDSNTMKIISNFIFNQSLEWGGEVLMIADPNLSEAYKNTGLYKFSWERIQEYFVSKELEKCIDRNASFEVSDGDGDHVFSN